jgi:hypothetical protein
LAAGLDGERKKLAGRGHAVQHAPGFNDLLEQFLNSAR